MTQIRKRAVLVLFLAPLTLFAYFKIYPAKDATISTQDGAHSVQNDQLFRRTKGDRNSPTFHDSSNSQTLTDSGKSRTLSASRNSSALNHSENYLKMVHTLYSISLPGNESQETMRRMEDIIRSGYGLKPYTTERGEAGWIENGIVYRPWRKPAKTEHDEKFPNPFRAEYEVYVPFDENEFFEGRIPDPDYKTKPKVIAWHTPTRYAPPMPQPGKMAACPDFPCLLTTNRAHVSKSAAVLFTAQIISGKPPRRQNPNQVFVLHNHEPPFQNRYWNTDFVRPEWKTVFNWTMNFRMDADIVVPYGIVRRRPTPAAVVDADYQSLVANKTKMAVWVVSNCVTTAKRDVYVEELRKYVDVDVYGECGKLKCEHKDADKCDDTITKNYKFFLAFESSYCPDYISEKMFHYLSTDTIVVARGSNDYFQHVPSEIFLNTANFPSPKKLAERMKFLAENADEYVAMLREKKKYMAITEGYPVRRASGFIRHFGYRFERLGLCQVCQRLWNLDKYRKSIPDSHEWFREQKKCYSPPDLKF